MPLVTTLAGTWTWNGTTTVASTDTSGVVVGDWIKRDDFSPIFKITAIAVNVSVTIENPQNLTIPSGTGAKKTQEPIANAIMAAADRVRTVFSTEPVTEPSAPAGTTRLLAEDYSSPTVHAGKKYRISYTYVNPPSSKAWGAVASIDQAIV